MIPSTAKISASASSGQTRGRQGRARGGRRGVCAWTRRRSTRRSHGAGDCAHDGLKVDVGAGEFADEGAVAQHRDAIADGDEFLKLRGGDEHGEALGGEAADQRHDLGMGADVDAARRLVQDEHARVGDQRPRQHRLLLVAARELADRLFRVRRGDAERLDHLLAQAILFGARKRPQPAALALQRDGDVLADRKLREYALGLAVFGAKGDAARQRRARRGD